ncbi:MBL fold metallo-hydrolase [Candidatus Aminicenantes bacterium AH-873-B07]|jgi:glyoxylase-like metal-dependent hydrolase (beta-lactamase superfamily II)|nr:MBL fold metallo-hydrolase [Candidatus Aminicenantes bacterium AH-873-B07]
MISKPQKIVENIFYIGNHYFPAYLIKDEKSALIDAGSTVMGPIYLKALNEHLGNSNDLTYILLTHSHYDHCGAVPYLKRKIRRVEIGASLIASQIFKKEKALEVIRSFNKEVEKIAGIQRDDIYFDKIKVDFIVEDGNKINLGKNIEIEIIATPGHTRCSVSYYLPKQKAIFFGEAGGVLEPDGKIRAQFLSSYKYYINSIKKLLEKEIEIIGLAHGGFLKGEKARNYLTESLRQAQLFKEKIISYLNEYKNIEKVVEKISEEEYTRGAIIQPKKLIY